MSLWDSYTKQVFRDLRYCASWLPRNRVSVGDIAVMENGGLERQQSIEDLGFAIETREDIEVKDWGWTMGTTFTVEPSLGAGAPVHAGVQVEGGLRVSFNRKNAILLRLERSREQGLERMEPLRREMLRLHDTGKWDPGWVVVTQVIRAQQMFVLVSEHKDASADLKTSAHIGADPAAVINAQGRLELLRSSGMSLQESGEELTPLYKALRVRTGRIRKTRIKQINWRGRARSSEEADVVDVTF
jgi:hypothetical protein